MTDRTDWKELKQEAFALEPWLVQLRHRLHACPERGFEEWKTAEIIRQTLGALGLRYRTYGTGTVVDVAGNGDAPLIALRADIDALPIQEQTGLPFASQNPGMMHACGHDTHTAMLLGAAKLIAAHADRLPGPVRLIFQPAEEGGGGAQKLVEQGVIDGVSAIYCLHVVARQPVGTFKTRSGLIHASSDGFQITVDGHSCHGASPHGGVDAIVLASHIVLALQELIAREKPATSPAVLTIGKIAGGTARNILCGQAVMDGTLRAQDEQVRAMLKQRIEQIAQGQASTLRGSARVDFLQGYCLCHNDEALTPKAAALAEELFGEGCVRQMPAASMGSEDFGAYQQVIPGVKLYIGTGRDEDIHTPFFQVDERMLPYGTAFLTALTLARPSRCGNCSEKHEPKCEKHS